MTTWDLLLQFVLSGLMVGGIYTLIVLGFNTVFNATEAIKFAQGKFVMLGGIFGMVMRTVTANRLTGGASGLGGTLG